MRNGTLPVAGPAYVRPGPADAISAFIGLELARQSPPPGGLLDVASSRPRTSMRRQHM